MSVLLICNQKDPKPWAARIQEQFPDLSVEIFPSISNPKEVTFLVVWLPHSDFLEGLPHVKGIQSLGAGVDHIFDHAEIPEEIVVARIVDPRLAIDMWEYCLAATLRYIKGFVTYQTQQINKQWQQHPYKRIEEIRVSILGLGQIGGYVAEQFTKLGFQVNGWSNSPKFIPEVTSFVGEDGLAQLLAQTDVLINILPLTQATRGMLNQKLFEQLPTQAYLINVGRGAHLIDTDLLDAIDNGPLSGATLDVFHTEPLPPDHPFWEHPKVFITPHASSITNVHTAVEQVLENIERFRDGAPLMNVVSAVKGY